ncbi:MAG: tetratricopeptide repeat protein [Phycisphaerae bacterium]|nr:tetratricopeptide repeat protein [Phycisphaerae bacterium]
MFSTTHEGPYQPLSWLTYALDYKIWGMNPVGYHVTSLLLHVAGAIVFFFVARWLLRAAIGAWKPDMQTAVSVAATVAALLFAVHPLRVESVAWATERRDVLSGLFFFLAVLSYLRARAPLTPSGESRDGSLGSTFLLFVAALLSKGTTLVLPLILVMIDFYPLRRLRGGITAWFSGFSREVWIEKIPFVVASILAGLMAIRGQMEAGALLGIEERGIPERIAVSLYSPAFFLWKTIVPVGLSPLYEWPRDFSPVAWPFLLSGVVIVVLTALFIRFRSAWPAGLVLWIGYVIFLLPILVPFQAGVHLVADRYSYLSCAGWALLAGGFLLWCWRRRGVVLGAGMTVIASAIIALLVGLTYRQTLVWRDTWTLWSQVLTVDSKCWHALGGLGTELRRREEYDKAIETFTEALRINPDSAELYNNFGSVYTDLGQHNEALRLYREAVRKNDRLAAAHYNLAGALLSLNPDRIGEIIDHLEKAIAISPSFSQAHHRLGNACVLMARRYESQERRDPEQARIFYEKALSAYALALRFDPSDRSALDTVRQVENKLQMLP